MAGAAHSDVLAGHRGKLYATICLEPGIAFLALHERLRSWTGARSCLGTLGYHLHRLMQAGLVVALKQGRYRRYFATNGASTDGSGRLAWAMSRDPTAQGTVHTIRSLGRPTPQRLACALGLTRQAVGYRLDRLTEAGLVLGRRRGGLVELTPLADELIPRPVRAGPGLSALMAVTA